MKNLSLIVTTVLLLTGCASLQEAYYIDREFGQHSQAAWDQQIAYPDYRYAAKTPETLEGITAENVMDVYNETFAEEPQDFEVIQFGLEK
ncbi:hypothetical protein [Syntrophotalea acetylenica]|uniref:Lipoprotein n=1 Tax=Syntrophotalea acetylenica TaxID=29542 RepID=A0A1L3GII1_SYNAC|nr:hypothetical protein [Syntrophotalea acetylenica]APG25742.1 hypothetical protein A7E75_12520 [Syntrophotalea acetylenica]APG43816.1 hypothetical protein A6070_06535 [Syntrophotalea acetylenica]